MINAGIKNRAMAVRAQRENAVEIHREVLCCLWGVDGRDVFIVKVKVKASRLERF
jgi:hypothetical protein